MIPLVGQAAWRRALAALVRLAVRPLIPPHPSLAASQRAPVGAPFDVIIVLGAPVRRDGVLGAAARERVEVGVRAFTAGLAPLLLFTGGRTDPSPLADLRAGVFGNHTRSRHATVSEADAMRAHALLLGVPPSAIVVEEEARSTEENARHTAALLRGRGFVRALLVTQPWHLRRSVGHFRRAGLEVAAHHDEHSAIYGGGLPSLRALRWVTREYVILAGDWLRRPR